MCARTPAHAEVKPVACQQKTAVFSFLLLLFVITKNPCAPPFLGVVSLSLFSLTPVERRYADHEHEQAAADQHQGIAVLPRAPDKKDARRSC